MSLQVFDDPAFLETRSSLDAAMKVNTAAGVSLTKKQAKPVPLSTETRLWERQYLGRDNPRKLTRTLIYLIGVNCGLRGGKELRNLKWGENAQLTLTRREGDDVLEYREDISKTYKGGLHEHHVVPKTVTVFKSDDPSKCLVNLFIFYSSLRPVNDTTNAFFLQPHPKPTATTWFVNQPLGHNSLTATIRNMMEAAGEDDQYSNQSCRKTTVTRIMNATGNKEMAKKVTGHRSDCVLTYNDYSTNMQKVTSNILTNSNVNLANKNEQNQPTDVPAASDKIVIKCPSGIIIEVPYR